MKRYSIIAILLLSAGMLSAQEKMISVFPAERQHPEGLLEGSGLMAPSETPILTKKPNKQNSVVPSAEGEAVAPALSHAVRKASWRKAAAAESAHAGYYNPEGTLFLGYTYNPAQTGYYDVFFDYPCVIGAWSYDLPCWKWTNNATGAYSSIEYSNGYLYNYPSMIEEHDTYSMDENYNFYDSIVARGSYTSIMDITGDYGQYAFEYATPVQTVHREDGDEYFALLTQYTDQDTLTGRDAQMASGGLYSKNTKDGMWPLTNAINTNKDGISRVLNYKVGSTNHYYFGTTKENGLMPAKFVTHYDKPQRKLYVKNITLALGVNGRMKLDSLIVDVYTEDGELIAHSSAQSADLQTVSITGKSDRMLTFLFQKKSEYNEMVQEGFSVDEAFRVEVSGIKTGNNFGIYAAKSSLYDSKTEIIMENDSVMTYPYDPYIMLNGIYPTLHDWRKVRYPNYETGQVGDTIPIKFNLTDGLTYKYGATYAVSTGDGIAEFVFMSTCKPYDATTRYWTMDIERPDYVTMSADYETHMGNDEEEPTIWEYYRAFTLYIYASEKPVIGDCIKIGKYGKSIVFRIDEVMNSEENAALARKLWKNGHIEIERAGKRYNALGQLIE